MKADKEFNISLEVELNLIEFDGYKNFIEQQKKTRWHWEPELITDKYFNKFRSGEAKYAFAKLLQDRLEKSTNSEIKSKYMRGLNYVVETWSFIAGSETSEDPPYGEMFSEEVIKVEMDNCDTVEEQITYLKGKLIKLKQLSKHSDIRVYDKLKMKLQNIKKSKKRLLKKDKKKEIDTYYLFDKSKILGYCVTLKNNDDEIEYLRKCIDTSKILVKYLDDKNGDIGYLKTSIGKNIKWMIDQYYKDQKTIDLVDEKENELRKDPNVDEVDVSYYAEGILGLDSVNISLSELRRENKRREKVFEDIRNCERELGPELESRLNLLQKNTGEIEAKTKGEKDKWHGTKSEFAREIVEKHTNNQHKYRSLRDACYKIFDKYDLSNLGQWTKEQCYDLARKN